LYQGAEEKFYLLFGEIRKELGAIFHALAKVFVTGTQDGLTGFC